MQIIKKEIPIVLIHTIEDRYPGKSVLYYDIETTGLSASRGMVYLIGMAYIKNDKYECCQLFAYNAIDESSLISEFAAIAGSFDVLVSFNGENFDKSFLKKRTKYLGLPDNIPEKEGYSLDIYKKIRKYCKILGLDNSKQKTIEQFIGITRDDRFSGKELIDIYRKYLISREDVQREQLLLHNYEDVCGLISMAEMLNYCDLFDGNWNITGMETVENGILILCKLKNNLPKEVILDNHYVQIFAKANEVRFFLQIKSMELKYFYEDYKNYYYLPGEDMAIHKSVAAFVEKDFREKARRENCYIKRSGNFVRNYGLSSIHVLKENYGDKESFVEVSELIQMDIMSSELREYLLAMLNSFLK